MDRLLLGLLAIQTVTFVVGIICFIRLYRHVAELTSSFAKMGFVVRQDLQQYFDAASQKVIEVQNQSSTQNQKLIEETMQKVLAESGKVMQEVLAGAERQASEIVLQAHQDRQRILDDAKLESNKYIDRLTDHSAEALEWAMEQLIREKVDLNGHQELVQSLVSVYLDEHKRS